jgi:hypothetical protein
MLLIKALPPLDFSLQKFGKKINIDMPATSSICH